MAQLLAGQKVPAFQLVCAKEGNRLQSFRSCQVNNQPSACPGGVDRAGVHGVDCSHVVLISRGGAGFLCVASSSRFPFPRFKYGRLGND